MLSAIHSEMKQNVDVLTLTQHILRHVEKGVKIDVLTLEAMRKKRFDFGVLKLFDACPLPINIKGVCHKILDL